MNNILRMIDAAIAATGESVSLLVELNGVGGYSASLVNVEVRNPPRLEEDRVLGETITFPNDWKMDLAVDGDSIREAVAALDALCAEGLT